MVQGRRVIALKEGMLLLHSGVIHDYPWLEALLRDREEPIVTETDVEDLPQEHQIFLRDVLPRVISQAIAEWKEDGSKPVKDMGEDRAFWIPCSICHTPNRWIHYIRNTITNESLNVGSDCIDHFRFERTGKSRSVLRKEASRLRRLSLLNNSIPGIQEMLAVWASKLGQYPILVPSRYEEPYMQLLTQTRSVVERFLSAKKDDPAQDRTAVVQIKTYLRKRDHLLLSIDRYVQRYKDHAWAPTRSIVDSLNQAGDHDTIRMLKQDGLIRHRTAHRITLPSFMQKMRREFEPHLRKIDLSIASIDGNHALYILRTPIEPAMRFAYPHRDFVLRYGGLVFDQEGRGPTRDFTVKQILTDARLYGERSIIIFVERLADMLSRRPVRIHDSDLEYGEIVFHETASKGFVIVSLQEVIKRFKLVALDLDGSAEDVVEYVLNLPAKRHTAEELKERADLRGGAIEKRPGIE